MPICELINEGNVFCRKLSDQDNKMGQRSSMAVIRKHNHINIGILQ